MSHRNRGCCKFLTTAGGRVLIPKNAYLEGGETLEEFLKGFPTVARDAAVAALEEAKHLLLARS